MAKSSRVFIKLFTFLWLICVVLCAQQRSHAKRDVHRIIIKDRSPRSHKSHSHHGHSHGRKKGHKKGGKKDNDESTSSSFEDSASFSSENSHFENVFHGHSSQSKHSHMKPSFNRHRFPSNLDIEESRHRPFREEFKPFYNSEWVPVNNDHLGSPSEHHKATGQKTRREKDRRNKRKSKKHQHKLPGIEFATPYTPASAHSSTLYPPIDVISTFAALNKKVIENNPAILTSFEKNIYKDSEVRSNNHKTAYDVTDGSASELGEFILVPDKSESTHFDFESTGKYEIKDFDGSNVKHRGNNKFRGTTKF